VKLSLHRFIRLEIIVESDNLTKPGKYCPCCGSNNIKWLIPQMGSIWDCMDCGYHGAVVIEDEELAAAIRRKFQKKDDQEEAC
jgi:ribosomal protein L37AE/L43A